MSDIIYKFNKPNSTPTCSHFLPCHWKLWKQWQVIYQPTRWNISVCTLKNKRNLYINKESMVSIGQPIHLTGRPIHRQWWSTAGLLIPSNDMSPFTAGTWNCFHKRHTTCLILSYCSCVAVILLDRVIVIAYCSQLLLVYRKEK